MSLASCIKKAGKALSKDDANAIREIRDELVNDGMTSTEANVKAIDEYLATLADERTELVDKIEEAGGTTAEETISVSKYSAAPGRGDLFGQDTTAAQGIADLAAERDAKRNTGQEDLETGDPTDMFSQASKQIDIEDITKTEVSTKKIEIRVPTDTEFMPTVEAEKLADPNIPLPILESQEGPYLDNLEQKMRKEGWRKPIQIVRGKKPYIYDGNHRLAVALRNNLKEVPIEWIDESEAKTLPLDATAAEERAELPGENTLVNDTELLDPNIKDQTFYGKFNDEFTMFRVTQSDEVRGRPTYVLAVRESGGDNFTLIGGEIRMRPADKKGLIWAQFDSAGKEIDRWHDFATAVALFPNISGTQTIKKLAISARKRFVEGKTFRSDKIIEYRSDAAAELPLRFKIEDDFTEGLVDKHPDNPISQMSKLGASVQEISDQAADNVSDIRKTIDNIKGISRAAALNAMPQSKLPEVIRNAMHGIGDYVRDMKRMDGFINERLEEQAETGGTWRDMIRKNGKDAKLLGEIMNGATLAQTDPSKAFKMPATFDKMKDKQKRIWIKRKRDHGILKKAWDKLSPEAQELYKKVRSDYENMRTEVMEALEKRIQDTEADEMARAQLIAELRKRFEKGRIEPYFPLARFGKHWGTAKDADGNVIAFIKRESRAERNAWVAEMRKAGYDAFASEEKSSNLDNVRRMDPNFVAKVTAMTENLGPQGQALADEIWQMYLRSLPEMSARTAFIHRVGRLGFTGDALRAYGHHMFHGTHQLGKLNYGFRLQGFLDNIDQEARELTSRADRIQNSLKNDGVEKTHAALLNFAQYKKLFNAYKGTEAERIDKAIAKFIKQAEIDAPWARPLADEMVARHEYNMNPQSSLWATKLTGLGFFWFLSTSPAAGMLNLTQTAIVGLPTLGARFNSLSGAAGALMRASGQLTRTRGDLKNVLRGDERKAFEEFDRIGMFSKTRVRDLTGYAERGQDFSSRGQSLVDLTSWIFHKTEKWNREVTGLAAYRMARKAGRSHDAAVLEAEELVEMSHFDYTNTNRPRFMQKDAARVVFLFRNYSLNMTYRLMRDFRDGVMRNPNVDVEVRDEAAKRLTGILGTTFMFTGLSGMPLAYAFHAITDAMLGDDDEPFDSQASMRAHLTDIWGEDVATFITKGAWDTFTQTTLSSRASLNNLWIREIPDKLSGKELFSHMLLEAAGPMAGIAANAVEGFDTVAQGHVERGLEKLVPKFASDAMKAIRYATEGALNYDRDVIMDAKEFTNRNIATQFFGFTPTPLTTRYEQQRAIKDYEAALVARKKYLMDRFFMAMKLDDVKEAKEVAELMKKFSQKNPGLRIDHKSLSQSAKIRADYDRRSVMGTTVPKKLHGLHEKFRMVDKEEE